MLTILVCASAGAQSKTTEALHEKNGEAFSLFFYNNTLRMLNQNDDKDFDELIKDIEKMKFLMIKSEAFSPLEYKKLVGDYKKESFEEIMSSRMEGKHFDVFLKEEKGKTKGMIVTVNDSETIYILDIVGSIALNKVSSFVSKLNEKSDIKKQIERFTKK